MQIASGNEAFWHLVGIEILSNGERFMVKGGYVFIGIMSFGLGVRSNQPLGCCNMVVALGDMIREARSDWKLVILY